MWETTFSETEILSAEWVRLIPNYAVGYPEPRQTWVTQRQNYEGFCSHCGTFAKENEFTILKEPALKFREFMTLIWGSALFCKNDVIEKILLHGIRGFSTQDVFVKKTKSVSKIIKQILTDNKTNPGLIQGEELHPELCGFCAQTKYFNHLRGIMHYDRKTIDPSMDIIEINEWFGGGTKRAFREMLISHKFAKLIVDQGWRGVRMKVVQLD